MPNAESVSICVSLLIRHLKSVTHNWLAVLRAVCARCGNCCIEPVAPVTDSDVRRLTKASGLPAGRIVRFYSGSEFDYESGRGGWVRLRYGRRVMGLRKPRGRCVFLNPDNRCSVYRARPMTCRTFPFEVMLDAGGEVYSLTLTEGEFCRHRPGKGTDPDYLRRTARREDAEDRAYHRRVASWNSSGPHGTRLDFLRFLGLQR